MRVVRIGGADADTDPREAFEEAAELLRAGRLVAFPTETVYGLGAHALDERAVQRIYEAKGRPSINPIIVHVADRDAARALSADWTPTADVLARTFWPGPITLVVRKRDVVPDIVTAGRDTVGLRVPSHPVALALIQRAGLPIAAPSANLSTQVSPTTAEHVVRGLGDRVDLVLDGGPTTVGIESTVVDATGAVARVLRPGMISLEDIAALTGAAEAAADDADAAPRSPGLVGRHYAPRARLQLFPPERRWSAVSTARDERAQERRVGAMVFSTLGLDFVTEHVMPSDPGAYARSLYATLHALDEAGCDLVLVERPPSRPEWTAIIDRLERGGATP